MKETKLISMTDFVLEKSEENNNEIITDWEFVYKVSNYANFLKQPLKLEMFVPCDDDGNVLENPNSDKFIYENSYETYLEKDEQYEKSREKVLFDGFEVKSNPRVESFKYIGFEYYEEPIFIVKSNNEIVRALNKSFHTIEDLVNRKKELTLTENAIKQLGL